MIRALLLDRRDDVAVLAEPAEAGAVIELVGAGAPPPLTAAASLPMGHKIAIRPFDAGTLVRKYGQVIGRATANVAAGEHVHTHNLASTRGQAAPPGNSG